LPEADIQILGMRGWILQSERTQLVFFEMEPIAVVPEHSHDYPQWGIVVEGKMRITIDGRARLYEKGDEYVIPPHAKHSATFLTSSRVIDLFQEKARYKPQRSK